MLSQGLLFFNEIPLTLLGLLLFIFTFTGVTCWTFLRDASEPYYREIANLPLHEDIGHE